MSTIKFLTNYVSTSTIMSKGKMKSIDLNNVVNLDISLKSLNTLRVEGIVKDEKGNNVAIEGTAKVRDRTFTRLKNEMLYKPSYCFFLHKNKAGEFVEDTTI